MSYPYKYPSFHHYPTGVGENDTVGFYFEMPLALGDDPDWLDLCANAKVLFMHLCWLYDGTNNGRIAMSVEDAMYYLNCTNKTASNALYDLQERGFIKWIRASDCDKASSFWRPSKENGTLISHEIYAKNQAKNQARQWEITILPTFDRYGRQRLPECTLFADENDEAEA